MVKQWKPPRTVSHVWCIERQYAGHPGWEVIDFKKTKKKAIEALHNRKLWENMCKHRMSVFSREGGTVKYLNHKGKLTK